MPRSEAGAWPEDRPAPFEGHGVWLIDLRLDDARRARCRTLLEIEEQARADRFVRSCDHDRFIASHAALRLVLAASLGTDAASLAFAISKTGRPSLAGREAGRLDFNMSHSGDVALVALSTTARIGVDIEVHRPLPDALRIARAHFHPREIAALAAVEPDCTAAFYAGWTGKEAYVKAVGAGLSMPLNGFAVAIPPASLALLEVGDAPVSAWTLIALAPTPDSTGAVAIAAPDARCRQARLPADWADRAA